MTWTEQRGGICFWGRGLVEEKVRKSKVEEMEEESCTMPDAEKEEEEEKIVVA